jgi:hypothetical protein
MKRLAVKVMVFLLLGAIVGVAVAWGCMLLLQPLIKSRGSSSRQSTSGDEAAQLLWVLFDDAAITPDHCFGGTQMRFGWAEHDGSCWAAGKDKVYWRVESKQAGWPFFGLEGYRGSYKHARGSEHKIGHGAIEVKGSRQGWLSEDVRFIPLIPRWPGFAINTLFYAGILWVMFAAPFALRRWRRMKRGLCPACAYPVGESDICTECGKRVRHLVNGASDR